MKRILIVDDTQSWIDYHMQILSELDKDIEFYTANSAKEGYQKLLENNNSPFDIIISDLQMELDFEPKHAGEWFVEQVKNFRNYYKTKVFIISGANNIRFVADNLGVDYLPKSSAINFPQSYESILN